MALTDHIARCNHYDLSRYRPFQVAGSTVGYIREDRVKRLLARPDLFMVAPHGIKLSRALATPEQRTAALEPFVQELAAEGLLGKWRTERYAVGLRFGEPPLLEIERGAVTFFGFRAWGVHMNAYVRRGDELLLWIARRSRTKPTYPGMLDNSVAGGQPAGLTVLQNLLKEAAEEAGLAEAVARRAKPVGVVTYCMEQEDGLKPDVLFCYDLELPEDVVPAPHDDEIEHFELWPAADVLARVRDTFEFKFNCNLVLIDFFLRHGLIAADDPLFFQLATGLRRNPNGPEALPLG